MPIVCNPFKKPTKKQKLVVKKWMNRIVSLKKDTKISLLHTRIYETNGKNKTS